MKADWICDSCGKCDTTKPLTCPGCGCETCKHCFASFAHCKTCVKGKADDQHSASKGIVELMFSAWQAAHANARKRQRKKLRGAK